MRNIFKYIVAAVFVFFVVTLATNLLDLIIKSI